MKYVWRGGAALVHLVALLGCARNPEPATRIWKAMGTYAHLSVGGTDSARAEQYADLTKQTLQELEKTLSFFDPQSELSLLNRAAGASDVRLSTHARLCLEQALAYARISGGAFDPTVGPLVQLWGFNGGALPVTVPDQAAIEAVRERTGYIKILLNGDRARLPQAGMKVDLGGIAKGYAVDVCYERLMALGARNVLVDLAGNMRCAGHGRDQRGWRIAVRNPFDQAQSLGTALLTDGLAVATSGNYERFVTIENRRYAHIVDPRTGRPVAGMAGVTVICASATEADGMSTALFVLGLEDSKPVLLSQPTCQALLVPDCSPTVIWVTPGFRQRFTPTPAFADRIRVLDTAAAGPAAEPQDGPNWRQEKR